MVERIQKLLANAGHGSRREIEQWIRWGESYVQRLCPIGSNSYGPPLATGTVDGLE